MEIVLSVVFDPDELAAIRAVRPMALVMLGARQQESRIFPVLIDLMVSFRAQDAQSVPIFVFKMPAISAVTIHIWQSVRRSFGGMLLPGDCSGLESLYQAVQRSVWDITAPVIDPLMADVPDRMDRVRLQGIENYLAYQILMGRDVDELVSRIRSSF